jgi:hypothetical protein
MFLNCGTSIVLKLRVKIKFIKITSETPKFVRG